MKPGRKPALVQWKLPLGQAAVPANKCVINDLAKQVLCGLSRPLTRLPVTILLNSVHCGKEIVQESPACRIYTHLAHQNRPGSRSSHHSLCQRG